MKGILKDLEGVVAVLLEVLEMDLDVFFDAELLFKDLLGMQAGEVGRGAALGAD